MRMFILCIEILLVFSITFSQTLRLNYSIPGPKSYNNKIGIVGAGPAGIHMALLLKQKGFKNIEILESSDRIGGKSYTIMHRGVPHEMGTCYVAPDYDTNIIPLIKKYIPGDLVNLVTGSVTVDGNLRFLDFKLYAAFFVRKLLNTSDISIITNHTISSMRKYVSLHKELLGEYDGEIPPEPSPEVSNQRPIQNLFEHLKWSFLQKLLTAFKLFSQKAPSLMFGWIVNTSLPVRSIF